RTQTAYGSGRTGWTIPRARMDGRAETKAPHPSWKVARTTKKAPRAHVSAKCGGAATAWIPPATIESAARWRRASTYGRSCERAPDRASLAAAGSITWMINGAAVDPDQGLAPPGLGKTSTPEPPIPGEGRAADEG